jgi:hypothetical protein
VDCQERPFPIFEIRALTVEKCGPFQLRSADGIYPMFLPHLDLILAHMESFNIWVCGCRNLQLTGSSRSPAPPALDSASAPFTASPASRDSLRCADETLDLSVLLASGDQNILPLHRHLLRSHPMPNRRLAPSSCPADGASPGSATGPRSFASGSPRVPLCGD